MMITKTQLATTDTIIRVVLSYAEIREVTIDELGYTSRSTCKDNKIADEMLGSFVVEDLKNPNMIFNIGSGFTKQERIDFWNKREELTGKIVTYKYFTVGMQNLPRFPIFKGFRDRIDIV